MTTELGANEVQIWYRHTEDLTDDAVSGAATLSPEERSRGAQFHFARDRRDYIAAHDLLRRSLSRYAPVAPDRWQFRADQHGKPLIAGPPHDLQFNLSHTRGLVACVIARERRVGIDVERMDRLAHIELLAERHFSDAEAAAMGRAENPRAHFLDLWTLKEAFIKAIGVGLSQQLNTVSFDLEANEPFIRFTAASPFNASEWMFALYSPSRDTRMAIAAHTGGPHDLSCRAQDSESKNPAALRPLRTTA